MVACRGVKKRLLEQTKEDFNEVIDVVTFISFCISSYITIKWEINREEKFSEVVL